MEDVYSVGESARRLEVSPQTVRDWVDAGKLPAMRTASGQRILNPADVERLRRERLTKSRQVTP